MPVYTHYSPFRRYFAECGECGEKNRFTGALIGKSEAGAAEIAKQILGEEDAYVIYCDKCGKPISENLWRADGGPEPLALMGGE